MVTGEEAVEGVKKYGLKVVVTALIGVGLAAVVCVTVIYMMIGWFR